jgi:hypothetical protein
LDDQTSPGETPAQREIERMSSPAPAVSRKKFAPGQTFLGVVAGVLLCLAYDRYSEFGTKTHYHYARNGKPDEVWIYRFGELAEFRRDRNLDGSWDHWTYYEHGHVVRSEDDNNFDGKPDETWTYSNGTVETLEKDTDFDGTPDVFCTYKDGVLQQLDIRPNGAKFATVRELYQNGILVETLRGGDSSGNFNEAVRYDPFYNPISTNKP